MNVMRAYSQSRRYFCCSIGVVAGQLAALLLIPVFGRASWGVWIVLGVPGVGFGWWLWVLAHQKVHETQEGLRFPNGVGWSELSWPELDHFDSAGLFGVARVDAHLKTGGTLTVLGLDPKGPLRWDGGQADDPITELNRRLAEWQAAGTGLSQGSPI